MDLEKAQLEVINAQLKLARQLRDSIRTNTVTHKLVTYDNAENGLDDLIFSLRVYKNELESKQPL